MDWDLTMERQSEALKRFVVMLFSMASLTAFFSVALPVSGQFLHLRNAALRLLWLAQATAGRQIGAQQDFPEYIEPPDILPREPHELLNAQNMAQRFAMLNRALDDLEAQAGRLVRWQSALACAQTDKPIFRLLNSACFKPLQASTPAKGWFMTELGVDHAALLSAPEPHDTS